MRNQPVRVLIVDDSAVVRGLIARALKTDPDIVVSGTAMHGETALSWMRKNEVDVVILDVEMPVMDGLTALTHIQSEFPDVRVVMASSLTGSGSETTVRALALGAVDCIAKPVARNTAESIEQLLRQLVPLVKALGKRPDSQADSATHKPPRSDISTHKSAHPPATIHAVAIGTSTGGPNALSLLLSALPNDFPLPIFIVQHMPPTFTPMLAKHIAQDTGRPCQEAVDKGEILRGHTYVAPGDFHMQVDKLDDRMVTRVAQGPPEHYCRPSVNPLFHSAAQWYGKSLLAVMLTGMGDDGIEGTRTVAEYGGYIIAQDEETSVVWGMPAAVARENLAHKILPLQHIAPTILNLCTAGACHT